MFASLHTTKTQVTHFLLKPPRGTLWLMSNPSDSVWIGLLDAVCSRFEHLLPFNPISFNHDVVTIASDGLKSWLQFSAASQLWTVTSSLVYLLKKVESQANELDMVYIDPNDKHFVLFHLLASFGFRVLKSIRPIKSLLKPFIQLTESIPLFSNLTRWKPIPSKMMAEIVVKYPQKYWIGFYWHWEITWLREGCRHFYIRICEQFYFIIAILIIGQFQLFARIQLASFNVPNLANACNTNRNSMGLLSGIVG